MTMYYTPEENAKLNKLRAKINELNYMKNELAAPDGLFVRSEFLNQMYNFEVSAPGFRADLKDSLSALINVYISQYEAEIAALGRDIP